ncbi:MAG: phosphotransferase [Dehalococcoidia bacterium]|nr:phosphotransferase [Dehalococcoidia bacterium]MYD28345.1 phosphotransferase [Dehalococcoidia bacterium]
MSDLPIPLSAEDFTPDWLTAALRSNGTIEDERVVSVEAIPMGEEFGFLGSLLRLSLTYDRPRAAAPATLIAKFAAGAEMNRAFARQYGIYVTEARFFQDLQPSLTAMPTVQAVYTDYDSAAGDGVTILEDLQGKLRIGDQMVSPPHTEALKIVEQSAGLHATWWGKADADDLAWIPKTDGPVWAMAPATLQGFWPVYQQNFGHMLTPDLISAVERTWAQMDWVFKRFATPPITVIHGDYRLDNMFFPDREGDPITVIDFQLMARGRGPYDIAYFASQSLDVEQRRATERELVRHYHDTLVAAGVRDYSFDDCFEDYRLATLWCAVYPIGMGGGLAGDSQRHLDLATEVSRRCFTAIVDLDAVSTLPS